MKTVIYILLLLGYGVFTFIKEQKKEQEKREKEADVARRMARAREQELNRNMAAGTATEQEREDREYQTDLGREQEPYDYESTFREEEEEVLRDDDEPIGRDEEPAPPVRPSYANPAPAAATLADVLAKAKARMEAQLNPQAKENDKNLCPSHEQQGMKPVDLFAELQRTKTQPDADAFCDKPHPKPFLVDDEGERTVQNESVAATTTDNALGQLTPDDLRRAVILDAIFKRPSF